LYAELLWIQGDYQQYLLRECLYV